MYHTGTVTWGVDSVRRDLLNAFGFLLQIDPAVGLGIHKLKQNVYCPSDRFTDTRKTILESFWPGMLTWKIFGVVKGKTQRLRTFFTK